MRINPIFDPKATTSVPLIREIPVVKKVAPRGVSMKFPVSKGEWREFKRGASAKGLGKLQTRYNTSVLVEALFDPLEKMWEIPYEDTGRYLTVEVSKIQARKIENLAQFWGISKRGALHRLMICTMSRGLVKPDAT